MAVKAFRSRIRLHQDCGQIPSSLRTRGDCALEPDRDPVARWSESDSRHFVELGTVYTPARDEICATILDLIPAQPDECFLAVELGVGDGWLTEAILERFPAARVLGLEGSPTMLRATDSRLQRFGGRFDLRHFQLEDRSWLAGLDSHVRCFVSSLVIHHLDGAGKRVLYRGLYERLETTGSLLIADLVAPCSQWERRHMARAWTSEVKRQSVAFTGSLDAYQQFQADHWNWYEYPDPIDKPSTVPEHLQWLAEAGFAHPTVFWQRAGHAIYGGYRPAIHH